MSLIHVVQELIVEVKQIKKWMRGIPSRWAGGGSTQSFNVINAIVGGSTLWSSGAQIIKGVKYDGGTSVTTVPSVDPFGTSLAAYAVGLGRGVVNGSYAWVCLRPNPGTGVVTGILANIPNNSECLSYQSVSLPWVGDSSVLVPVYILNRF